MATTSLQEHLNALKLYGMEKAYYEQKESSSYASLSFEERLSMLVERETMERDNRRLSTRLKEAKLRHQACIEHIDFHSVQGLDKTFMLGLSSGKWIKEHLNILITGPCGVGKSYIACALGHSACLQGYKTLYVRAPRLFEDIVLARADGRYSKMITTLAKTDVLIIDDWGLSILTESQRRDMLEIVEDRYGVRSTIITSQVPSTEWYDIVGEATLADAILDRLIHNAYSIELDGDSLRKLNAREKGGTKANKDLTTKRK
jgi:DNA replication protein DnaC